MKNCGEADHAKHAKRITEGELWDLAETGEENVRNNGVLDGVMNCDSAEDSSHALNNDVNQDNKNDCILVTRYSNGK